MGHRLLRVNESLKEVLSAAIAEGLKDPRIGFVTVTGVETTPDLRQAKVFFSVLGGARERTATLEGLEAATGYLQSQVNAALHMKRTPQLTFVYDETTDRAMRIERLLRREAAERPERPPGDEPATDGHTEREADDEASDLAAEEADGSQTRAGEEPLA